MPRVFLSHKSQDKDKVLAINAHLKRALIDTWIDVDGMQAGDALATKIHHGIAESPAFIAFISERYFDSDWCPEELEAAYNLKVKKKLRIIPVLMGDREAFLEKGNFIINNLIESTKCLDYKPENPEQTANELIKAVWKPEPIRFSKIREIEHEGIKLQVVSFETDNPLPADLFQDWHFRLDDFMAESPAHVHQPIRHDTAVGFFGRGPNWVYSYLAIPLANKREIFMYNTVTEGYICVYARQARAELLGKVIPSK